MTKTTFDDETLMAFADGEIDEATARLIEAAMETDDELVARVALFIETRASAQSALRPLLEEPVPDALAASVGRMIEQHRAAAVPPGSVDDQPLPGNVTPFKRKAEPVEAVRVRRWLFPVAASVVAVVVSALGYLAGSSGSAPRAFRDFAGLTDAGVVSALGSLQSGEEKEPAGIRMISSFRDQSGVLCREFEMAPAAQDRIVSVACRQKGTWAIRIAVVSGAGDTSAYSPASAQEGVDTYLASIGASAPLSAEEERQALENVD